jgi:hypothetical protein
MLGGQRPLSFDGTMDSSPDVVQRDAASPDNNTSDVPSRDGLVDHSTTASSSQAAPAAPSTEVHTPSTDAPTAVASSLTPDIRVLAADVERESEKVRSFYAAGEALNWEDGAPSHTFHEYLEPTLEAPVEEDEEHDPYDFLYSPLLLPESVLMFHSLPTDPDVDSHPPSLHQGLEASLRCIAIVQGKKQN